MEDYKKKYEEALNSIRESFDYNNLPYSGIKEKLEKAFPELKEGEDERIRKEMIEIIRKEAQEFPSSVIAEKSNSWIAWLEKQGEQKSVDNLKWNELTWEDINTLEEIINNVHYDFRNGIGEESFGKEVLERFREIKGDEYMDTCEQKSAWSEEDEKYYQGCLNVMRLVLDAKPYPYYNNYLWLKSIKEKMKGE